MAPIKQFMLPDVGEGLTEADILAWHVAPGETVAVNQVIVEIETAKAAVELPCPYAGVVTELYAEPGTTVHVGSPLLAIDLDPAAGRSGGDRPRPAGTAGAQDTGDATGARHPGDPAGAAGAAADAGQAGGGTGEQRVPTLVGYGPRAGAVTRRPRRAVTPNGSAPPAPPPATAPSSAAPPPATAPARPAPPPEPPVAGELVPQTKPPVRKLAKELGVDLRAVTGTGRGGVITREDVLRAAAAPGDGVPQRGQRGERRVPVRGVRKATAAAMVTSAFTAPHVTEFLTVDVTPMMRLRDRLRDRPEFAGVKLTPLGFAARALCLAVRRTPEVNARWDEDAGEIVYFDYVHLGIAAATPRGLVVPKIRDADGMSLREIAVALDELTTTAREGRSSPTDLQGGTISITNIGVFGVDTGTPILNPGEAAILALGAIRDMPWVVDGEIAVRKVCQLALSFDHRVVDGQQGSQFLADIGALLADPALALAY